MDSKDFERGSSGDGADGVIAGEFPSDLSELEGIIPPPPPPAWAFMADDDPAPSPQDNDPEAVQPPASAASEATDEASFITSATSTTGLADAGVPATGRAEVAPADLAGLLPARAAVLLDMVTPGESMTSASNQDDERGSDSSLAAFRYDEFLTDLLGDPPPSISTSSARPPPEDEGSARPAIRDERDDGREEEKREEGEDDEAPRPPEMVAAAFEEVKPELISDDGYAQVPPGQIRHRFEEEKQEEGEDDEAPLPPEMVAAAFEEAGPELIDDDGYAPVPPDMIAASFEAGRGYEEEKVEEGDDEEAPRPPDMVASSFEGHGYEEEEKREEGEDDEAPRPPSMMAASCEENDAADHKATKATKRPPVTIDEGVDPQVPVERNDGTHMKQRNRQEIINRVMREIDEAFDNDGTPANTNTRNRGSRSDPSSSSNQPPFTASNVQAGAPSITPTPQRRDQRSLSLAANDQQGHVWE
jgi:uncharacterized OsmC-like protein